MCGVAEPPEGQQVRKAAHPAKRVASQLGTFFVRQVHEQPVGEHNLGRAVRQVQFCHICDLALHIPPAPAHTFCSGTPDGGMRSNQFVCSKMHVISSLPISNAISIVYLNLGVQADLPLADSVQYFCSLPLSIATSNGHLNPGGNIFFCVSTHLRKQHIVPESGCIVLSFRGGVPAGFQERGGRNIKSCGTCRTHRSPLVLMFSWMRCSMKSKAKTDLAEEARGPVKRPIPAPSSTTRLLSMFPSIARTCKRV